MAVAVPLRPSTPVTGPDALFDEARRRQRRRRASMAAAGIALVLVGAGLSWGFGGHAGPAPAGLGYRAAGIVVRHPASWYIENRPLQNWTDPVQRFVLSSYRIPPGVSNVDGDYSPPAGGAIAELLEEQTPGPNLDSSIAPRPRAFELPPLTDRLEGFGDSWGEQVFRERGREFYLFIGVGHGTSSAVVGELLTILDGMTIAKHG